MRVAHSRSGFECIHPGTLRTSRGVDSRMRTRPSSLTPTAALSGIWGLLLIAFVVAALYFGRIRVCANRPGHPDHVFTFEVGHSPGALDRAHRGCVSDGHCDVHHFRRSELGYRPPGYRSG